MIITTNDYTLTTGMEGMVADLIKDWGYNPDDHTELIDIASVAILEDAVDTAYELMRQRGLRNLAVESADA